MDDAVSLKTEIQDGDIVSGQVLTEAAQQEADVADADVLHQLRDGWVASNGLDLPPTNPKKKSSSKELDLSSTDISTLLKKATRTFPRAAAAMAKEAIELFFGRKVAAAVGGAGVVVLLGGGVAVGALLYAGSVGHIFDPKAAMIGSDAEKPAASSIYGDTTQASLIPAPKTGDDGDKPRAEDVALGGESGGLAPNLNGVAVTSGQGGSAETEDLPPVVSSTADSGGAAATGAPLRLDEGARKAVAEQSGRGQASGQNQRPVAARSESPAVADRPTSGGGSSTQGASRQFAMAPAAQSPGGRASAHDKNADQEKLMDLEREQVMAATGASHGDIERTAVAAVDHGGRALFEVQHVNASTGGVYPARIVLTSALVSFVPEAAGDGKAFSIPLRSVRTDGKTSGASMLRIEFGEGSTMGQVNLREVPSRTAALLVHVRNVIQTLQRAY